jgi:hypothetical protein
VGAFSLADPIGSRSGTRPAQPSYRLALPNVAHGKLTSNSAIHDAYPNCSQPCTSPCIQRPMQKIPRSPQQGLRRSRIARSTMLTKMTISLAGAVMLTCTPALAQMGDTNPALGVTSPLGIGPGSPVGSPGIPMGATEMAAPGVSPPPPGASTLGTGTSIGSACSGATQAMTAPMGAMGGAMGSTTPFDGGGNAGTPSGTCTSANSGTTASPATGASAPVPRTGIPMGALQLSPGGLSPPPTVQLPSLVMPPVPSPLMPGSSSVPASPPFSGPASLSNSSPSSGPSSGSSPLTPGGIGSTSSKPGRSMLNSGR